MGGGVGGLGTAESGGFGVTAGLGRAPTVGGGVEAELTELDREFVGETEEAEDIEAVLLPRFMEPLTRERPVGTGVRECAGGEVDSLAGGVEMLQPIGGPADS